MLRGELTDGAGRVGPRGNGLLRCIRPSTTHEEAPRNQATVTGCAGTREQSSGSCLASLHFLLDRRRPHEAVAAPAVDVVAVGRPVPERTRPDHITGGQVAKSNGPTHPSLSQSV